MALVTTWDEEQLALIRPNYPEWDLWIVPCYMAPTVWCAKPKGASIATINAGSREHLVGEIRQQEQKAVQRPE